MRNWKAVLVIGALGIASSAVPASAAPPVPGEGALLRILRYFKGGSSVRAVVGSGIQVADEVATLSRAPLLAERPQAALGRVAAAAPGTGAYTGARAAFLDATSAVARLKVAAVQYPIEGGLRLEDVLAKMERLVLEAKRGGAELVVLPELFSFDMARLGRGVAADTEALATLAHQGTPKLFARARALSLEHDVAILAGSSPRVTERGIVNTAQMSFADGRVVLQDKLNLTPEEVVWKWVPGNELQVFDAPWGRTVILICYDAQFSALSTGLMKYAPEVILVPSMTGEHGFHRVRWAAQARAVEQHAFVVVTGTVEASGLAGEYVGEAAVLTPRDAGWPGILATAPANREAIVYAELDLSRLRDSRRTTGLFSARDELLRAEPVVIRKGAAH